MTGQAQTTQTPSTSFVINLENDAAAYLEQQAGSDINAYLVKLIQEEKQRQAGSGSRNQSGNPQSLSDMNENTPDTSGYPEMKGHFS